MAHSAWKMGQELHGAAASLARERVVFAEGVVIHLNALRYPLTATRQTRKGTVLAHNPPSAVRCEMDRALLEQHLAQVERHVAQGEAIIARQRRIVSELERDGHDAGEARDLLAQFQEMQAQHITHRDRLRRELAVGDGPAKGAS